jgi:hypothetical protein
MRRAIERIKGELTKLGPAEVAGVVSTRRAHMTGHRFWRNGRPRAGQPDLKVSLDSLAVLAEAMRHFYINAMVEQSMGETADWKAVDAAMVQGRRPEHHRMEGETDAFGRQVCADVHLVALYGGLDHRQQTSAIVATRKRARDEVGREIRNIEPLHLEVAVGLSKRWRMETRRRSA